MTRRYQPETTKEKIISTLIWLLIWTGCVYVGLNSGNAGYLIIAYTTLFLIAFLVDIWSKK